MPGVSNTLIYSLIVDAQGRLYAATSGGVYRSTDGGAGFKAWAAMEHFRLTRDRRFLTNLYPRLLANSRWQEQQRSRMRVGSEKDRPLTYGLIDDLGVREVQRLLARHLAAAQAAFGPPGLGVIDLPHLPGGRLVPAQIHAAAVLYWAAEVERAGLLPFVEALAQGLIDGSIVIPLGGAAQRLGEYWHSRTHRFTAAERAALYARVLGEPFAPIPGAIPGGAGSPAAAGAGPGMPGTRAPSGGDSIYSTPPGMITPDPLAPLTGGDPLEPALRSLVGQLVAIGRAGPLSGGTGLISARAVVQAQNLGAMLTQRGAGVAAFAARDIVAQIRSALQILGDGDLSRALGGGSPWQIVARHAPAFLRRVVDAQTHLDLARSGMRILSWVGDNAGQIEAGRLQVAKGNPVIAEAEAWLAAAGPAVLAASAGAGEAGAVGHAEPSPLATGAR